MSQLFSGAPSGGSPLPSQVRGWNWGAFTLSWIWGLANRVPAAFLVFVPVVNLAMPFVLGAMGNRWAWENRRWETVDQFRKVQRQWALAGLVTWLVLALLAYGATRYLALGREPNRAYHAALARLAQSQAARSCLGGSLVVGEMETSELQGSGAGQGGFSFAVRGDHGAGRVFVRSESSLDGPSGMVWLESRSLGCRVDLSDSVSEGGKAMPVDSSLQTGPPAERR